MDDFTGAEKHGLSLLVGADDVHQPIFDLSITVSSGRAGKCGLKHGLIIFNEVFRVLFHSLSPCLLTLNSDVRLLRARQEVVAGALCVIDKFLSLSPWLQHEAHPRQHYPHLTCASPSSRHS